MNVLKINPIKPKRPKKKTAQNSERWELLIEFLEAESLFITGIGGAKLEKKEIEKLIGHFDDLIKTRKVEKRNLKSKQWREKNK